MRTMAWPHPIKDRGWVNVREEVVILAARSPEAGYLVEIVDSVITSGRASDLAVITSAWDLIVTANPVQTPPTPVVRVRAPGNWAHEPGTVRIEDLSHNGRNDAIERPVEEAVPLFWRFMIEKVGVAAVSPK